MFGLGVPEMIVLVILVIALFAAPSYLPKLGRKLGRGVKDIGTVGEEFRRGLGETRDALDTATGEAREAVREVQEATGELKRRVKAEKAAEKILS